MSKYIKIIVNNLKYIFYENRFASLRTIDEYAKFEHPIAVI